MVRIAVVAVVAQKVAVLVRVAQSNEHEDREKHHHLDQEVQANDTAQNHDDAEQDVETCVVVVKVRSALLALEHPCAHAKDRKGNQAALE